MSPLVIVVMMFLPVLIVSTVQIAIILCLSLQYKKELKPGTVSKDTTLCLPTSTHSIMLY